MRLLKIAAVFLGALLILAARRPATGTITGKVLDEATQAPIPSVVVIVVGANRGAITDEKGVYTITGVPSGRQVVRAEMIGYKRADRTADVRGEQGVIVDFKLAAEVVAQF